MAKKSKSHTEGADAGVMYLSLLAGLIALASIFSPWYYKPVDPTMGIAWAVTRSYSPLGPTSKSEGQVMWSDLATKMCSLSQQYISRSSGIVGVLGEAAAKFASTTLTGVDVSSAAGCSFWDSCREHVTLRCAKYRSLKYMSMAAATFLAFGALAGLITVLFLKMEGEAKKKQKVYDARMKTMVASVVAFMCVMIGVVVFYTSMEGLFTALNQTAYYPRPDMSFGIWMGFLALAQTACACSCAIYRHQNAFPATGGDDDEALVGEGGYGQPQGGYQAEYPQYGGQY